MNHLSKVRAVIFDMDGVLVNTEDLYKEIEKELFARYNLTISHDEHLSYQGTSNVIMWEAIRKKHNLSTPLDELVDLTQEVVIAFFEQMETLPLMDDVVALLEKLHQKKIKMALASSSTIEVIEIVLRKTGISRFFDAIVDSSEAGAGKPDPSVFLLAMNKLNVQPSECFIIEDSVNGIKAANSAGVYCIAYNGPGSEHQDQSAADLKVSSFLEVIEFLEKSDE